MFDYVKTEIFLSNSKFLHSNNEPTREDIDFKMNVCILKKLTPKSIFKMRL